MYHLKATFNHGVLLIFLLIKAITMPISLGNCEKAVNLTEITWDHGVNSWKHLNHTLTTDIQMIEADVIIGVHNNETVKITDPSNATLEQPKIPIMGHPPSNSSDLSFEQFLTKVIEFNTKNTTKKGIKLDFKSIEAVEQSMPILKTHWKNLKSIPVWINADILKGPVNSAVKPVNADKFFTFAKDVENATLSIGWTTNWGSNFTNGSYSAEEVDAMIKSIEKNKNNTAGHPITFPVRAGIAAQSKSSLQHLYDTVSKTNKVTFTIWSSNDDHVDVKQLQAFILSFGVDKVYVDVPKTLKEKLNLSEKSSGSASSIVHFGLLNVFTFAVVVFLRNGLN